VRQKKFDARFKFAAFQSGVQADAGVSIAPDRGDGARMTNIRITTRRPAWRCSSGR